MEKNNKGTFILTMIVMFLPVAAGIILWDKLPAQIATHFDINGNPDGYNSKVFTVFAIPFILIAIHLICIAATSADPKNKNIIGKIKSLLLWIVPATSVITFAALYSKALGYDINITFFVMLFISVIFIIIGNYLPKCRQNYTIGIKLPWTLEDEDIWNKTHRISGRLWVAGGFIMLINTIFHFSLYISIAVIIAFIIVPVLYSFYLYKTKDK